MAMPSLRRISCFEFREESLGGTAIDEGRGIAVDSAGEVVVVGSTFGTFPISSPTVLENIHQGGQDGFSAALTTSNATGSS